MNIQSKTLLLFTKSESPVNVPLLDLWLRELKITNYKLAYHTQVDAYTEWKGPCLAFGWPAVNAATKVGLSHVFIPMPFRNLRRSHDNTPLILKNVRRALDGKGWLQKPLREAKLKVIRDKT